MIRIPPNSVSPKQRRALLLLVFVLTIAGGVSFLLARLNDNLVFYLTPTQLQNTPPVSGQNMRLGGFVKPGSIQEKDKKITFVITDFHHDQKIFYTGPLPSLFREGQGVIAEGRYTSDGMFYAETLLARHDENYKPPDVSKK